MLDPIWTLSRIDRELLNRANDRIEILLPTSACSRTDISDFKCTNPFPKQEIPLPKRTIDRTERELPALK
jgi:hypothetical protein